MPIWKLTPIPAFASDDSWAFTRWHGPILVRANNPGKARKIAAEAFVKTAADGSGSNYPPLESPWLNDGLVVCRRMPVSTYRTQGPEQILQPHLIEYGKP